ncbi:hypothetical protein NC653_027460 [Populus alba x Populus x berolinensis]|uniref:Uncharacterized protein n=1 Tax=Populus alba x Populus x berolinensis TaxID=444605 RepID=A0AAD6M7X3_9ROSI|nr:hypothetical protein NC653_027460 [Populus alba x Populus x berolinensis]
MASFINEFKDTIGVFLKKNCEEKIINVNLGSFTNLL